MAEPLMTVEEVAEWLRCKPDTIYKWRYIGAGPKGFRVRGRVLFRRSDVEEWIELQADGGRVLSGA
jgi:excisionase family DNA binding protein